MNKDFTELDKKFAEVAKLLDAGFEKDESDERWNFHASIIFKGGENVLKEIYIREDHGR